MKTYINRDFYTQTKQLVFRDITTITDVRMLSKLVCAAIKGDVQVTLDKFLNHPLFDQVILSHHDGQSLINQAIEKYGLDHSLVKKLLERAKINISDLHAPIVQKTVNDFIQDRYAQIINEMAISGKKILIVGGSDKSLSKYKIEPHRNIETLNIQRYEIISPSSYALYTSDEEECFPGEAEMYRQACAPDDESDDYRLDNWVIHGASTYSAEKGICHPFLTSIIETKYDLVVFEYLTLDCYLGGETFDNTADLLKENGCLLVLGFSVKEALQRQKSNQQALGSHCSITEMSRLTSKDDFVNLYRVKK